MLDSNDYLTKRGWKGKGTALRSGGIAKPIAVTAKRSLSGLGKDRDEAFPFWEHVYNSSLGAIKIKLDNSDTESDDGDDTAAATSDAVLRRTSTGILSNKRPTTGISAHTPSISGSSTPMTPRDILAQAKRDLAKRELYSRFYRGPVVTNVEPEPKSSNASGSSTPSASSTSANIDESSPSLPPTSTPSIPVSRAASPPVASSSKTKTKKRKRDDESMDVDTPEADTKAHRAARKAARQAKKEAKAARRAEREARRAARADRAAAVQVDEPTTEGDILRPADDAGRESSKTEKRKKKRRKDGASDSDSGLAEDVSAFHIKDIKSLSKEEKKTKKRKEKTVST